MKILFISRTFPPVIGGIETQNYGISWWLAQKHSVTIIANTKGKAVQPFYILFAFMKTVFTLPKYDIILLGDGVLGILGYLLKFFTDKPVVCIVHGLDITYASKLYQKFWVGIFLKKVDSLIAVGNETILQGIKRSIPESKFYFIPNGISPTPLHASYTKKDLEQLLGRNIPGSVLLTLGRLVERKGIAWFIDSVMPHLGSDIFYVIAGDGIEKPKIINAIEKNSLQNRIYCIGSVTDTDKEILYCTADLYIQPNIKVEGDMEGFGLVVLEAASYGLPVIASDLEGLKDAIKDGENGILVPAKNAAAYKDRIEYLLNNKEQRNQLGLKSRNYVTYHYAWEKIAARYIEILEGLLK